MFTDVKVFSATKAKERDDLGEQVTRWLRANADLEVVDRTVMQLPSHQTYVEQYCKATDLRAAG